MERFLDEPSTAVRPTFRDNYAAPVVYFDGSVAFGTCAGAIQIELVSRILVPRAAGGVDTEMLVTGRLRCTPLAAKSLQDSIERALEILSTSDQSSGEASKFN